MTFGVSASNRSDSREGTHWVVCHFSLFLLSTGRQIDTGRRTSIVGRQGEGDWCGKKAAYSMWATVPPSWLWLVNQASPLGLSSILRHSQQLVLQPVTRRAVVTATIDRAGWVCRTRDFTHLSMVTEVSHLVSVSVCRLHALSDAKSPLATVSCILQSFLPQ